MPELMITLITVGVILVTVIGALIVLSRFYRKVGPDEAIVRTGIWGLQVVSGNGIMVIPVMHRADYMDLSVKRIEIARRGASGLICKDNVRADIEVAFFIRVNNTRDDIIQVAQALGCRRASEKASLVELFDAKFSEALKTVGKHFDFVDLYTQREKFKEEILKHIGRDLNGYILDDCAIDFLEQTPIDMLNEMNILDAEGIKKITSLTAQEHMKANEVRREKEKVIKKQDVEAQEAIYELEKQRVEASEKQKREIAEITARENADSLKAQQEQRLRFESARIATEEELMVAEQNKERQVIVAQRNKERTDAVERERVEKDRMLEVTERERIVGLASIEKEKAIEVEKRNIQDVIRERVVVERTVVEEQQKIKDTEEFATADRVKRVAITAAEKAAEESLVKEIKAADAAKQAAIFLAEQSTISADADLQVAEKQMRSKKLLAEARQAEAAANGLAEAQVLSAQADAIQKEGTAQAIVIEKKLSAEAAGQKAKAEAHEKQGLAEANVLEQKFAAEARGIEQKAEAMKIFDGVGREHEEFKLRLNKDRDIEIAAINAQKDIAREQSGIVGKALESARIDIVGGETEFFNRIVNSVQAGKSVDRLVQNSQVLTDVKNTFFEGEVHGDFKTSLSRFASQFGMSFEDVKDMSVAALIGKMLLDSDDDLTTTGLKRLQKALRSSGLIDKAVGKLEK